MVFIVVNMSSIIHSFILSGHDNTIVLTIRAIIGGLLCKVQVMHVLNMNIAKAILDLKCDFLKILLVRPMKPVREVGVT